MLTQFGKPRTRWCLGALPSPILTPWVSEQALLLASIGSALLLPMKKQQVTTLSTELWSGAKLPFTEQRKDILGLDPEE